ncbi:hypothetical protein BDV25DRAFT_131433 [Aspergillus avenaceus]|uniref:Uncharacterized protein n=1 Tax=Aspergillus avenaceus TaxID=36643 RepID=A0A5N6TQ07_ASPAV|nr:hypothetical protein BDV25DRAFT_131433 [Aspergillus avenaceus]
MCPASHVTWELLSLALNLRYTKTRRAIDCLGCSADETFIGLQKHLLTLTEELCAVPPLNRTTAVDETRELYTTLATVLTDSPGPDPDRPLPPIRNAISLRLSGDVALAMVMFASCWFRDYVSSSISSVVEIWSAWLPSRQSGDDVCFVPANHQYVGTGQHDACCELEAHNGRGVVNFTLRSFLPRVRYHRALDIKSFRDIMAFQSGLLVSDCVFHNNRDIGAFLQTAAQLVGLILPSEADDLWSGQPLVELGRLDLYIRQVKHLTVCSPIPRNMAIIYSFLYSLTSSRHNSHIRGKLSHHLKLEETISCCPAPFCGQNLSPCELDRDLPLSRGSAWNPLSLVLQAVLQEGLSAAEWQTGIDARIYLCHEWSRGLQPQFGQYDPVAAAVDVAPLCIRIMSCLSQLI